MTTEEDAIDTPRCKKCSADFVRLSRQWGLIERLLTKIKIYPFRCQSCGHRFFVRQPGKDYSVENDKREYTRVKAQFSMTFKSKETEGKGRMANLSIRGCSFETDTPLVKGEMLQMVLKMPDARPVVDIDAAIVRYAQGIRYGVEFLRIAEQPEKELRVFVEQRLQQQSP